MEVLHQVSLKPYSTFGIEALAHKLIRVQSVNEFMQAMEHKADMPMLILGGGSNILFTGDFPGLVIKNEIPGLDFEAESDDFVIVKAGAGLTWHTFVRHCIGQNWGGLENLSLIPGKVGAAPMQNIGAYGVEIKDCFHSLEALNLETGEINVFDAKECRFGYRESTFKHERKNQFAIVSVSFRLSRRNHQLHTDYGAIRDELRNCGISQPGLRDISDAVIRIRQSKLPDPTQIGNAGSFFKNPVVSLDLFESIRQNYPDVVNYPVSDDSVKLAAGWLIEKAGWKGYRKGDAGVHAKQALVLVNYGSAKGSDLVQLSEDIMRSVYDAFGVQLEREVNIV